MVKNALVLSLPCQGETLIGAFSMENLDTNVQFTPFLCLKTQCE